VAARADDDGVLILSEFAGAAEELTQAVRVNPYDLDGMTHAMRTALTMPADERRARMRAMRRHVMSHTVQQWAATFLQELETVQAAVRS
jgi:trehalose-6-phosphate synthase